MRERRGTRSASRSLFGALTSVATVLVLASCSAAADDDDAPRTTAVDGPWADEFRAALDDGVSDFEASILADGQVSTAELAAAHTRVESCLADSGLGIEYDPDGGFELTSLEGEYPDDYFERSDPVLRACEGRFDEYVTFLYQQTRRNPERLDDAEITVACLQDAGLVGEDYDVQQWRAAYDDWVLPFADDDPKWRQCDLDPLGLWRTP